jgi:hypothetical protein
MTLAVEPVPDASRIASVNDANFEEFMSTV